MRFDVAILGAGASGMTLAILLARKGIKTTIIEKQNRGGKKILASGNGKCNITNINLMPKHFYGKNRDLIKSVITKSSYNEIKRFFKSIGLEFFIKDDGKVYPKSQRASIVLELLEFELKRLNVTIFYNIDSLDVKRGFKLTFNNLYIESNYLILATGSPAAPQLGGNSSGFEIAKSFGHSIIKPLPALVALNSKNRICRVLNGVKIRAGVRLIIDNNEKSYLINDLLFTKYGVSGLAILDLSFLAVDALEMKKDVEISIDFFPDFNKDSLLNYFKSRVDKQRKLPINLWLGAILDSKVVNYIVKELNLYTKNESNLNTKLLKSLVNIFKNYKIKIDSYRDFKYAEVAKGGINSKEIKNNLESKFVNKLYFIGEVLDIVGARGGYNFSFAWCSAFKVAKDIINSRHGREEVKS